MKAAVAISTLAFTSQAYNVDRAGALTPLTNGCELFCLDLDKILGFNIDDMETTLATFGLTDSKTLIEDKLGIPLSATFDTYTFGLIDPYELLNMDILVTIRKFSDFVTCPIVDLVAPGWAVASLNRKS